MKEISDFSTSVMWRNVKLIHMWRNFRFLHICHVHKFEISPHDRFFLHGHRPQCPRQISGMFEATLKWLAGGNTKITKDDNLGADSSAQVRNPVNLK